MCSWITVFIVSSYVCPIWIDGSVPRWDIEKFCGDMLWWGERMLSGPPAQINILWNPNPPDFKHWLGWQSHGGVLVNLWVRLKIEANGHAAGVACTDNNGVTGVRHHFSFSPPSLALSLKRVGSRVILPGCLKDTVLKNQSHKNSRPSAPASHSSTPPLLKWMYNYLQGYSVAGMAFLMRRIRNHFSRGFDLEEEKPEICYVSETPYKLHKVGVCLIQSATLAQYLHHAHHTGLFSLTSLCEATRLAVLFTCYGSKWSTRVSISAPLHSEVWFWFELWLVWRVYKYSLQDHIMIPVSRGWNPAIYYCAIPSSSNKFMSNPEFQFT